MRIIFICPGLEAGKDGVGDYVTRLSTELTGRGHEAAAVSLYDYFVSDLCESTREEEGGKLKTLRIPAKLSSKTRITYACNWIKEYNPHWISLQYVSFGYNKYGLPVELLYLKNQLSDYKFHLMFHELWCGITDDSSFKIKFLGILQKALIRAIINKLDPDRIFTNTVNSANNLEKLGVKIDVIPVFSNIAVNLEGSDKEWEKTMEDTGLHNLYNCKDQWLILGFFGTIYDNLDLLGLLKHAAEAALEEKINFGLIAIGHGRGQNVKLLAQQVKCAHFWETGSLPPTMINRVMNLVDIGVVTTRIDGLDKSGSAITWLERGIPVIISSHDHTYSTDLENQGVFQVTNAHDIIRSLKSKKKFPVRNRLEEARNAYASMSSG